MMELISGGGWGNDCHSKDFMREFRFYMGLLFGGLGPTV